MKNLLIWILYLIPALLIELFCYITTPVVALFVTKELRTDRVKRMGNQTLTFDHEYLIKPLRWWQTHDNALDEWWWGEFNKDSFFKFAREADQEFYDKNWWFRYFCRVMWMWRNCAYGFHYNLFARPNEEETIKEYGIKKKTLWYRLSLRNKSFQFEIHLPVWKDRYMSLNIGWKEHKGFPNLMYANRIIGPIRKFE